MDVLIDYSFALFYSSNSRAFGPNHTQLCTSVEEETEQKTDNKTRHEDQNKVNK